MFSNPKKYARPHKYLQRARFIFDSVNAYITVSQCVFKIVIISFIICRHSRCFSYRVIDTVLYDWCQLETRVIACGKKLFLCDRKQTGRICKMLQPLMCNAILLWTKVFTVTVTVKTLVTV